jgi:hypothetical protein
MDISPSEIRKRAIDHFAQLILLLVNIIQGIALALLAQKVVAVDWSNPNYASMARLITCLAMIWFITFQYVVAVATLFFVTNGVRDILAILVLGIAEYGTIYVVTDAHLWLAWLLATIFAGIFCFLSTVGHVVRMTKETSSQTFVALRQHTILNFLHLLACGFILSWFAAMPILLPAAQEYFEAHYGDFVVPLLVTTYSIYVMVADSSFIAEMINEKSTPVAIIAAQQELLKAEERKPAILVTQQELPSPAEEHET